MNILALPEGQRRQSCLNAVLWMPGGEFIGLLVIGSQGRNITNKDDENGDYVDDDVDDDDDNDDDDQTY